MISPTWPSSGNTKNTCKVYGNIKFFKKDLTNFYKIGNKT